MTNELRYKLSKLGFNAMETDAISSILGIIQNEKLFTDTEERSTAIVNKIRETYSLSEEVAILRKEIENIYKFSVIQPTEEYKKYNEKIEEIKKSIGEVANGKNTEN